MSNSGFYKVERKEEFRVITKEGDVLVKYRIFATSKGGTFYHVEVGENELDKADQVLAARAKALDAIA